MKQKKARMLTALITLSVCGASHASMGDDARLTGLLPKLGVNDALQNKSALRDGVNCASRGGLSVPLADILSLPVSGMATWDATTGVTPSAAGRGAETERVHRSPLLPGEFGARQSQGKNAAVAARDPDRAVRGHFQRIEILQYAQSSVAEAQPGVEPAHAAVMTMEARHRHFMKPVLNAELLEYRLDASADEPDTMLAGFNLSPCLDSSKRFVAKRVAQFRTLYQEAG